jgi:predicted acyltransferase
MTGGVTSVPRRLVSLDVFRGITVAAMVIVNNPGSWEDSYAQLRHAPWHGWTMTDMVFPFFLWIVGISMVFSFTKRRSSGEAPAIILRHVLTRSAILFLLGIVINGFPFGLIAGHEFAWSTVRIPGVLQRIAICYLGASVMLMLGASVRLRVLIAGGILLAYWAAMMLIPVPGFGAAHLEPEGNLCWFVDSRLLSGHTWVFAPAPGFDPEGILSTLPALSTTILGTLAGELLGGDKPTRRKVELLAIAGLLLAGAGLLWGLSFPVNKNLWTSSYVLFSGGFAAVILAAFMFVIDVRGFKAWTSPLKGLGMNAITVFLVSELLATLLWVIQVGGADHARVPLHDWIYFSYFAPLGTPAFTSLLFALAFTLVSCLPGWVLAKAGWSIKV